MEHRLLVLLGVVIATILMAATGWWVQLRRCTRRSQPTAARGAFPIAARSRASAAGAIPGLDIRPLSREEARRFAVAWRAIQARFIDDPRGAVTQADRLVGEVLHARAFPLGEIERYAGEIAVGYPRLPKNYSIARGVALRLARGHTNTEELRQAFVAYRALFEDLLELVKTDDSKLRT
jgi:hypothetical protein